MLTASRYSGHATVFRDWHLFRSFDAVVYGGNDVQQSRTGNQVGWFVSILIWLASVTRGIVVSSLGVFVVSPGINGPSVRDRKTRSITFSS